MMGLQHMGIASNAYVLRSSVSCRRLVISILFPSSLLMIPAAVSGGVCGNCEPAAEHVSPASRQA